MSFIDIIAILLIICLSYVGYLKGLKGKTFFLISFAFSSFLMYFIFGNIFIYITNIVSNLLIAGVLSLGFIFVPIFVATEFILRKTLLEEKKLSFSQAKKEVAKLSRIAGSVVGFFGGYAFVFAILTIGIKNTKDFEAFSFPSFIQDSFFYKLANDKKEVTNVKADNLKPLSFLYSEEVRQKYFLSEEETIVILKMIKGISNHEAKNLLNDFKNKMSVPEIMLKLKEVYELELDQIEQKYTSDPNEIKIIFERFKTK